MGLKKGMTNNTKGRPKGKPNKTTEEIRTMIQNFISDNLDTLQEDFDKLDSKDRLVFIERILKQVLPAPLTELERLTDEQLDELIYKLKMQNDERKTA